MRSDLDPHIARDIFVGTMDHIITRWLLKDRSYSLFENLDETFDLMTSAFRPEHFGASSGSVQGGEVSEG